MRKNKVIRIVAFALGGAVLLLLVLFAYVRFVSRVNEPVVNNSATLSLEPEHHGGGLYTFGRNWFRKSESGLYELYVEGDAFERGVANGKLTRELVQYQEDVFTRQINRMVPSDFYRHFLKYVVGWFNRNLDEHVKEEYRLEILGVSRSASADYNYIAPAYQRILNYHAAHDIGHALQNMSLVGCTSFATWGAKSQDSTLIIGRNFDFYAGDDFARDKIIAFYRPLEGHKFMMVTFGGMIGVLSGMNDQGLTVTINAAKSDIPYASATPVSLVAREILQYASTISEAYDIARSRRMFVAESFLIGSAKDGKAAIIEKSPDDDELVYPEEDYMVCTNHFQGIRLGKTELNMEHMNTSASVYRYDRVKELLLDGTLNSAAKTASILRNRFGKENQNIGLGNEKSINQLVAHHSIIFVPEKRLVWVSTSPWQLGRFVCYDLNKVFSWTRQGDEEVFEKELSIAEDPFLNSDDHMNFVKYSPYRFVFTSPDTLHPDSLVKWNPDSYQSYLLAGDYCLLKKEYKRAESFYEAGLAREIATLQEKEHMERNLNLSKSKLK